MRAKGTKVHSVLAEAIGMDTHKGQQLGYVRVSSVAQNVDRQLDGIQLDRTFTDKLSGKDTNRPQLQELLRYARQGDTVHVHSLDRLGRNFDDLRNLVNEFKAKGVVVIFHKENLTFSADTVDNARSELMFIMMASFAQFERALIKERQREGIAVRKAAGLYAGKGRKRSITDEQIATIKARVAAGEKKSQIAADMGISRESIYKILGRE